MLRQIISSKIFILSSCFLVLFLSVIKYRQIKHQNEIEKEKNLIIEQIETLQKKNQEFADSLKYLNTTEYKEKVGRQQLNLKKLDEQVFSFAKSLEPNVDSLKTLKGPKYNLTQWIKYFSGKSL